MAAPRTVTSPPSPALSRLPPWIVRASAPAICAAISLLVGAHELGLFSTSLSLPLRYSYVDDTKFYLALIKGVLDHGWWTTNPSLGFPFGQQLYDFPQGGVLALRDAARGCLVRESDPRCLPPVPRSLSVA